MSGWLRRSIFRWLAAGMTVLLAAQMTLCAERPAVSSKRAAVAGQCRSVAFEGSVRAGQAFRQPLGQGLELLLEPVAAGWWMRVVPVAEEKFSPDYAELATPPYNSVNPLLLSTDYGFRAQDAVGWNPRHFQFLLQAAEAQRATAAYHTYMGHPQQQNNRAGQAAMQLLAGLPAKSAQGELQILDAHLVPGTADQVRAAGVVASHFTATPHTLDQPTDGKFSALGRIDWLRFRVVLVLPRSFLPAAGLQAESASCFQ